jgi:hypothetical protein
MIWYVHMYDSGIVLSAAIAASARSLYEVLHEQLVSASFIHTVSPVDALGAVSYVKDIKQLDSGLGKHQLPICFNHYLITPRTLFDIMIWCDMV